MSQVSVVCVWAYLKTMMTILLSSEKKKCLFCVPVITRMSRTHNQDVHGGDHTVQRLYNLPREFHSVTKASTKNEDRDAQSWTPGPQHLHHLKLWDRQILCTATNLWLTGSGRIHTWTHTIKEPLRDSAEHTQTPQHKGDLFTQKSNHGIGEGASSESGKGWEKAMGVYFSSGYLRRQGEVCARKSFWDLIGQLSQNSQIMNFDCWTLVFVIRNESVVK